MEAEEELFTFGNTKKICIDAAKLDAQSQATRKAKEKKIFAKGRKTVVATSVRKSAKEESAEDRCVWKIAKLTNVDIS